MSFTELLKKNWMRADQTARDIHSFGTYLILPMVAGLLFLFVSMKLGQSESKYWLQVCALLGVLSPVWFIPVCFVPYLLALLRTILRFAPPDENS